eukprot:CAMPEP_0117673700 /NCGR_PEP_ID=MMETSP0804-20121206/14616_1 /TAXON_ID=1074897 /ORGANISM="Tetraselmis astigmatica, Strain CCMP880" /LENGTH=278 /DNA_ID=CAMNT_0005482463 /DNA_START=88 /DNA_END=922 /DNA_ORIENTATION=+
MAHLSKDVAEVLANYSSNQMTSSPPRKRGESFRFSESGSEQEGQEALSRRRPAPQPAPAFPPAEAPSDPSVAGRDCCHGGSPSTALPLFEDLGVQQPTSIAFSNARQSASEEQRQKSEHSHSHRHRHFSSETHSTTTLRSQDRSSLRYAQEASATRPEIPSLPLENVGFGGRSQPAPGFNFSNDSQNCQSHEHSSSHLREQQARRSVDESNFAAHRQRERRDASAQWETEAPARTYPRHGSPEHSFDISTSPRGQYVQPRKAPFRRDTSKRPGLDTGD